jgi:hypothetical protein
MMNAGIGEGTSEEAMIKAGYKPLPVGDLLERILDHTNWGDYLFGYRFVSYCDRNGRIEGTNNVGSYNTGRWEADSIGNTFSVSWQQSWVPATLRAYLVDEKLHFFNQHTGLWHMNFDKIAKGRQPLEV